jgi:hypothetical protein
MKTVEVQIKKENDRMKPAGGADMSSVVATGMSTYLYGTFNRSLNETHTSTVEGEHVEFSSRAGSVPIFPSRGIPLKTQ